ncbi:MAG: di-trans,poly-cis-decaprenylcistransferase [Candidatus Magasanikbacteria bacterium RIFCSPLOWO2_02_FULL_44_11]|uniref:Isoprenyl transferase n=1 Tax=Candidatus Magasanikbacteria bacterium RIFCSPLOWO2_02_FULL_44_11 TaxID=1798689 RepID=A0A1F6N9R0_9BACT|nr:MAG: di-trans,poly-cis-decaprenylcistransferase [Candidatus Magasanikbacteria bacterium RIFCSPLOWO2_02_FULL_44_11]
MSVPQHVGVIVDGNRRWAKAKGLPTLEGHEAGYRRVKELARWLFSRGVKLASFYLFSRENWHRSKEGVAYLMRLLEQGLARDVKEFKRDAIRLLFAGGREQLPPRLRELMRQATEETKQGTAGTVCACINYGGQQEIVEAVQRLAASGRELSELSADELKGAMTTAELPPCDLIIRTSGEQRLSNFLLWESAYAELYFTPTFFPDFNEVELDKALAWFSDRQRRFGT